MLGLSVMQVRLRNEYNVEDNVEEDNQEEKSVNIFYGLLENLTYSCCMGVEEVYEMCWE